MTTKILCPFCFSEYPKNIIGNIESVSTDCPSQCDGQALLTIVCPNCGQTAYTERFVGYTARMLYGRKDDLSPAELKAFEFGLKQKRMLDLNSSIRYKAPGIIVIDGLIFVSDETNINPIAIYLKDWESVDISMLTLDDASTIFKAGGVEFQFGTQVLLWVGNKNYSYNDFLCFCWSLFINKSNSDFIFWVLDNKELMSCDFTGSLLQLLIADYPEVLLKKYGQNSSWDEEYDLSMRVRFGKDAHRIVERTLREGGYPKPDFNVLINKEFECFIANKMADKIAEKISREPGIELNPETLKFLHEFLPCDDPRIVKAIQFLYKKVEEDATSRKGLSNTEWRSEIKPRILLFKKWFPDAFYCIFSESPRRQHRQWIENMYFFFSVNEFKDLM